MFHFNFNFNWVCCAFVLLLTDAPFVALRRLPSEIPKGEWQACEGWLRDETRQSNRVVSWSLSSRLSLVFVFCFCSIHPQIEQNKCQSARYMLWVSVSVCVRPSHCLQQLIVQIMYSHLFSRARSSGPVVDQILEFIEVRSDPPSLVVVSNDLALSLSSSIPRVFIRFPDAWRIGSLWSVDRSQRHTSQVRLTTLGAMVSLLASSPAFHHVQTNDRYPQARFDVLPHIEKCLKQMESSEGKVKMIFQMIPHILYSWKEFSTPVSPNAWFCFRWARKALLYPLSGSKRNTRHKTPTICVGCGHLDHWWIRGRCEIGTLSSRGWVYSLSFHSLMSFRLPSALQTPSSCLSCQVLFSLSWPLPMPIVPIPLQPHFDAVSDETDRVVVLELLSSAMKLFFKVPHSENCYQG